MIILDTNVVSELMKGDGADRRVVDWLHSVGGETTGTTAITVAEVRFGLALLPAGRRRDALVAAADSVLGRADEHLFAFDVIAAEAYAHVMADRRGLGRPVEPLDGQIAAICRVHDATLATRNTDDFADTGITVIDPWGVD